METYEKINLEDYIQTGEGGTAQAYTRKDGKTLAHNMKADRSVNLFHITPETFNKHWNIFLPAYLGTTDPGELEAYTKRLFPFYAAKVPYVFDMAYHTSLPPEALQKIVQLF